MTLKRRDFLKHSALIAAVGLLPAKLGSFSFPTSTQKSRSFIIRNAIIHTLDPQIGDFEAASILVENGEIIKIGKNLNSPGGIEIIDGSNSIIMPGLIDCHWHLWTSILRSMSSTTPEDGYFPMTQRYSRYFTPEDMKIATRYAAAEAINSGITTLCDFNHNARTPAYVMAGIEALAEAGIRAKVMYGGYRDKPEEERTNFIQIEEVLNTLKQDNSLNLISLGLGSRGAKYVHLEKDWEKARQLGLNISIHASSNPSQIGHIKILEDRKLLGKDVNIIHANSITREEIKWVAASEASITCTPFTEMRIGFGLVRPNELMEENVNIALGIDTTSLSGNADMFGVMKVMQNIANARAGNEFFITPHQVMQMGTIQGARALGLEKLTGSLTPGKRADLIMLKKNSLNFSSNALSKHLIVEASQPQNVDFVAVDGKILKRNGELINTNPEAVIHSAEATFKRLYSQVHS